MNNYFLFCFFFICSIVNSQNTQIVFRYDDFRLKEDILDERIIKLFQKYQIPLTLGIIPCDQNEMIMFEPNYPFLPELKRAVANGSVEIALHGLTHVKLGNGEFGNVKKEEQYRRIKKGKSILDSIFNVRVVTFIPPWNAYDENTLDVMEQLNMKGISSALCVGQSFKNEYVSYFPNTIDDLKSLPKVIDQNKHRKGIIVVMFHSYDFNTQFDLSDMESYLAQISKDRKLKCKSFKDLYAEQEISDGKRMSVNLQSHLLYKYLQLKEMIQTTNFAIFIRVLNLLFYVCWSVLLYSLSLWLLLKKKKVGKNQNLVTIFCLIIGVGMSVWFQLLAPLKLFAFALILSILLPLLVRKLKIISR